MPLLEQHVRLLCDKTGGMLHAELCYDLICDYCGQTPLVVPRVEVTYVTEMMPESLMTREYRSTSDILCCISCARFVCSQKTLTSEVSGSIRGEKMHAG